jgi:hypothetical protein
MVSFRAKDLLVLSFILLSAQKFSQTKIFSSFFKEEEKKQKN